MPTLDISVIEAGTGRGIDGVAVTCGDGIAITAADGSCQLDAGADDRFVWISTPAGWRPADRFYRALPTTDEVVFELVDEPASRRGEGAIRLAQFTDTHVVAPGGRVGGDDLAAALAGLMAESSPDLLVASGDLTNLGAPDELDELEAGLADLPVPLFPMFGGHDGNAERRTDGNEPPWTLNWESRFGPAYYSFDWGSRHIVLWPNEDYFFAPAERDRKHRWLQADLARHADRGTTILVTHLPPPATLVDEWDLLGVELVLHGHWHSVKAHRRGGVTVASAPPLCFGGIDTTPRGYRVVDWDERGVQIRLAALGAADLSPRTPDTFGRFRLAWERDLIAADPGLSRMGHRASPTVVGERVYMAGALETAGAVSCVAAGSGDLLWSTPIEAPVRNTVCVADGHLLALAMTGAVYCMGTDGRIQWRVELEGHPDRWLYTSPTVADGVVYAGGKGGIGAFRLQTGEPCWYTSIDSSDAWSSYASPMIVDGLVVQLVARRGLLALSRKDGSVVWETELEVEYPYAAPVVVDGDLITGSGSGQLARLSATDGGVQWQRPGLEGKHASGLATDGSRLFTVSSSGVAQAFDAATGAALWQLQTGADRLDMTPYERGIGSSLMTPAVGDRQLLVGASDGQLRVVDSQTGEIRDEVDFGVPLTATPALLDDGGFVLGTWDGRLLRYDPA